MRKELIALGFYERFRTKEGPDESRVELRLRADHSLVACMQCINKPSAEDRKINGQFEFILLEELSTMQIEAAQRWLMESMPPFCMRVAMQSEPAAA